VKIPGSLSVGAPSVASIYHIFPVALNFSEVSPPGFEGKPEFQSVNSIPFFQGGG
jgi:hypothetical protein